jgi:hypothetical protein
LPAFIAVAGVANPGPPIDPAGVIATGYTMETGSALLL